MFCFECQIKVAHMTLSFDLDSRIDNSTRLTDLELSTTPLTSGYGNYDMSRLNC